MAGWGSGDGHRVHLPAGFRPDEMRVRAVCHCGWDSTPRVDEDRALLALSEDHGWTDPVCVRCGRDRAPTEMMTARRALLELHRDVEIMTIGAGVPAVEVLVCLTDTAGCEEISARRAAEAVPVGRLDAPDPERAPGELAKVLAFRPRSTEDHS